MITPEALTLAPKPSFLEHGGNILNSVARLNPLDNGPFTLPDPGKILAQLNAGEILIGLGILTAVGTFIGLRLRAKIRDLDNNNQRRR